MRIRHPISAGNYMFKVNNKNTRIRCEICSKLTIKTPDRRQWRRSEMHILKMYKPFLSEKYPSYAKMTLIKDGEVISSDNETADVVNTFFSNVVSNFNLP